MEKVIRNRAVGAALIGLIVGWGLLGWRAQEAADPVLVTNETRGNANALSALEKPGKVIFRDDFESEESFGRYFDIRGLKEGNIRLDGKGAVQMRSPANDGNESGAWLTYWFGPEGYDRVHLRYYMKFASDFEQGSHTGGSLSGIGSNGKWDGMGRAGLRPKGDDFLSTGFEPWRDRGRLAPPGVMHLYTYWMDMKGSKDGKYWGNFMQPNVQDYLNPVRDRWYCMEVMIQLNEPGKANGELAAWIDGKLYIHYKGFRWRTSSALKLKRFSLTNYVSRAREENTVWFDDVVLSTGYVGPRK